MVKMLRCKNLQVEDGGGCGGGAISVNKMNKALVDAVATEINHSHMWPPSLAERDRLVAAAAGDLSGNVEEQEAAVLRRAAEEVQMNKTAAEIHAEHQARGGVSGMLLPSVARGRSRSPLGRDGGGVRERDGSRRGRSPLGAMEALGALFSDGGGVGGALVGAGGGRGRMWLARRGLGRTMGWVPGVAALLDAEVQMADEWESMRGFGEEDLTPQDDVGPDEGEVGYFEATGFGPDYKGPHNVGWEDAEAGGLTRVEVSVSEGGVARVGEVARSVIEVGGSDLCTTVRVEVRSGEVMRPQDVVARWERERPGDRRSRGRGRGWVQVGRETVWHGDFYPSGVSGASSPTFLYTRRGDLWIVRGSREAVSGCVEWIFTQGLGRSVAGPFGEDPGPECNQV